MKVKNLLAAAALCLFSGTASAQVNSYGSLYFQYNPSWLIYNIENVKSDYVNGFTLGYFRSIGIGGDNVPLFLEVGGNLQYGVHTTSEDIIKDWSKAKETLRILSVNIPVNFGYSIRLGDNLALNPYVGIKMRLNILAADKVSIIENSNLNEKPLSYKNVVTTSSSWNLYSSDDMGGSDNTWNRFQIGWQAGAKMVITEAFFVEAGYYMDFNRIASNTRFSSVNLGFGYCF